MGLYAKREGGGERENSLTPMEYYPGYILHSIGYVTWLLKQIKELLSIRSALR